MLSSSFDWFLKLWNPKITNQCLKTFDYAEDYIYDVQWNPIHPTLFASSDGEGTLDFWDLSADF
jgi:dynein intermediate chain